jgi:hypothetical protein
MAIKLTSGSLYFLKEKDFITNEESPYVKIGLVRGDKETQKRILEHKTGNPRQIIDYFTLEASFVENLETQLHYRFAACWISGEWFLMNQEKLNECIGIAKGIIKEQSNIRAKLSLSYELASQSSNGEIKVASSEDQAIWESLCAKKLQLDEVKAKSDIIENRLRQLMSTHMGIGGVVDFMIKSSSDRFDKKSLEKDHPEIYQSYCSQEEKGVVGSFLLKGNPKLKDVYPELYQSMQDSKFDKPHRIEMVEAQIGRSDEINKIHREYILLQPEVHKYNWEYDMLEAQLKVRVGSHDWIGTLCQWTRKTKVSQSFDSKKFQMEQPKLHAEYMIEGTESYAISVRPYREYKF